MRKELEALRHENEWILRELQNVRIDVQQTCVEAQQARRDALQGATTFGNDEIKAVDPPRFPGFHKQLEGWVVACQLGIASQPSKFTTEGKKIIWAASFLDGPPRRWMQPLINAYLLDPKGPPRQTRGMENLRRVARQSIVMESTILHWLKLKYIG